MKLIDYFKNKKYVIWDWNGTLLDDLEHTWKTGNSLLAHEGRQKVSLDYYLDHFVFPVSEYYRGLGFDVDNSEYFKKICNFFVDTYMKEIKSCRIKPEMKLILKILNEQGLKQSILSAADQVSLQEMVSQQGVESYFENIFGLANKEATCKVGRGRELINKLSENYSKNDLIIVGDTLHDLEVGHINGVDVVLVTHGHNSKQRLLAQHDKVVDV